MDDKTYELEVRNTLLKTQELISFLNDKLQEKDNKIKELKEDLKTWDLVTNIDEWIAMDEVSKVLNIPGLGRNKLFELLRDLGILRHNNQPYQQYVDKRYFKLIEQEYYAGDTLRISLKTVISQIGIDYIRKAIDGYNSK